MFNENFFGTDPVDVDSVVTIGRFANWPVNQQFAMDDVEEYFTDESKIGEVASG